ncbi:Protein GAMETE EXPRESSED 1 like protein [Argiope bruennichi]|uniref:Protein GAMETE EXPRESSED 1 like protein n=1 Tax=Argiope bruennichi TaxID=94029 RepID=A0A8T0E894_ARGBR|nr:Protein GAMETE EXPRESSED 1 like protein [Argiope bruennichi]
MFAKTDSAEVDLNFQDKLTQGESLYKELVKKSYGSCWKEALSHLHFSCKHLTEEIQSRLALSFTNCFLKHSGSEICPCPDDSPISTCLGNSSDRVFSTYTEFFTHTQSICHYLQHREWQEQTHKTVAMLTENSEIVSKKLDESRKTQSKILDMQQVSLSEQRRLISNGRSLNKELAKSRSQARYAFDEFKASTNEQKHLIFEIFDRVKGLQHFVLGEFTSIYTFAYYFAGVFVIYLITSVPQTASARIWLLLLKSGNVVLERILVSYNLDEEMTKLFPLEINGPIYSNIWMCRKCVCIVCFIVLLYFYHSYKDYNSINNQLLREIQRQNSELQEALKSLQSQHLTTPSIQATKESLEYLFSTKTVNHESSSLNQSISVSRKLKEKIKEINNSFEVSSQSNETKAFTKSDERIKTTVEKTPEKRKKQSVRKINTSSKEATPLSAKENFDEYTSPQKRYNLRSRGNTPAQSPNVSIMSPVKPKDLVDAVSKKLENKLPISNRI